MVEGFFLHKAAVMRRCRYFRFMKFFVEEEAEEKRRRQAYKRRYEVADVILKKSILS